MLNYEEKVNLYKLNNEIQNRHHKYDVIHKKLYYIQKQLNRFKKKLDIDYYNDIKN